MTKEKRYELSDASPEVKEHIRKLFEVTAWVEKNPMFVASILMHTFGKSKQEVTND